MTNRCNNEIPNNRMDLGTVLEHLLDNELVRKYYSDENCEVLSHDFRHHQSYLWMQSMTSTNFQLYLKSLSAKDHAEIMTKSLSLSLIYNQICQANRSLLNVLKTIDFLDIEILDEHQLYNNDRCDNIWDL